VRLSEQYLGAWVKALVLERLGPGSHNHFAELLGVSKPRVRGIFRGENMTEDLLRRCLQVLGVDVELVVHDDEP
jgi:plasmid maintenance system antidote protein VapI